MFDRSFGILAIGSVGTRQIVRMLDDLGVKSRWMLPVVPEGTLMWPLPLPGIPAMVFYTPAWCLPESYCA
jgi:hypothetical protein